MRQQGRVVRTMAEGGRRPRDGRGMRQGTAIYSGRWCFLLCGVVAAMSLSFSANSAIAEPTCAEGPELKPATDTIEGTSCADVIVASSPGVEKVVGGGGDDIIIANGEVEEIYGGEGSDTIYGEQSLSEEALSELIDGSEEATTPVFRVTPADLRLRPRLKSLRQHRRRQQASASNTQPCGAEQGGTHREFGGDGNQTMIGGPGADWLYGQRGNDSLCGGLGNDYLSGGPGDDPISGNEGNDILTGGYGGDVLDGGNDSDLVRGDATTDVLEDNGCSPGCGTDTLSFATATAPGFLGSTAPWQNFPGEGQERGVYVRLDGIQCASGYQACNGDATLGGGYDVVHGADFENVIGSPFSDIIVGNAWANRLDGGGGADVIYGSAGEDVLVGGEDGDFLQGEGGADWAYGGVGFDNCWPDVAHRGSCEGENMEVRVRDPNKVSVGYEQDGMDGHLHSVSLYMVGSVIHDSVWVHYWRNPSNGQEWAIFTMQGDSWSTFDTSESASSAGCNYAATEVSCLLNAMPDSLDLTGGLGDDQVNLYTGNFPEYVSTLVNGGLGSDSVLGSGSTEDVLIDGEGAGNDFLTSLGFDDVLVNNAGADTLEGGLGNDLLLSTEICGGDTLNGARVSEGDGVDQNSASWAKMPGPWGVAASLSSGSAGSNYSTGPICEFGSMVRLAAIDDLEGSQQSDVLIGDGNPNGIMGRLGSDLMQGRDGNDLLMAGSVGNSEGTDNVAGEGGNADRCEVDNADVKSTCEK